VAVVFATVPLLVVVWGAGQCMRLFQSRYVRWLIAFAVVPLAGITYWFFFSTGPATEPITMEIRPGTSFSSFASRLDSAGITKYPSLLRIAARVGGIDSRLHVGLYMLSPEDSPCEILTKLSRHEQIYMRFTVVEGAALRDCIPEISASLNVAEDSLWQVARSADQLARLGLQTETIEGYVFPETYTVPWGVDAAGVLKVAMDQSDTVWRRVSAGYSGRLSRHEATTLASLIEAEAQEGSERGTISSVFHNRLRRKMKLQCDPTIIFAMGGLDRPLLRKDWEYDSPYNTYRVFGLPPGPIGSPGEASLRAALYPDTTGYLYFMAQGDGTHTFTKTLREHEAAYQEAKRKQRRGSSP
jgi:UPF0755 protein